MSEELLAEEARRRAKIFENLEEHLKTIARIVKQLDQDAEIYLFGSVAEGRHLLSSDIDVLVVTDIPPGEVLAELWKRGVKDPFEIHVVTKSMVKLYRERSKLVEVRCE